MTEPLPGAKDALTFGILPIVLSIFCCGPFGAIFSFIGLSKAKQAERIHEADGDNYSGFENIKTAKILCYIGLGLAALMLVLLLVYFAIFGFVLYGLAADGNF